MLQGVAIAIGLLKMLLELQESQKSGALDIAGPAARVRLFMESGQLVHADEGTVGETLGRLLLREQVVDHEQYTAAIEWMADLRASGKKAMLGEVFVDLGLLSEQQVRAALAAQLQSKAMRALGWSNARFRFIESPGPLVLSDRFVTPLEPLVVAALRLADREPVDALLAGARERHAAIHGDRARIDAFRFPPGEDAFARGLDATRTVRQLLTEKEENVDRPVVLAALLLTDILDLHLHAKRGVVPRPAPVPPLPSTKLIAPPISSNPVSSAVPVGPETPVRPMAPLLAEQAYQAGKRLARANRLAEAVVELRRAAVLYPAVEYNLWATWAEARADEEDEDSHAPALRVIAELAVEEDSERGFATFVLGYLARRRGEDQTAEMLFERARTLDPRAIEEGWEARLRVASAASAAGPRSDVRALAPLLTTPGAPGVEQREGGGVATLRGLAAEEALAAARAREEEREKKKEEEAEARATAKADARRKAELADRAEAAVWAESKAKVEAATQARESAPAPAVAPRVPAPASAPIPPGDAFGPDEPDAPSPRERHGEPTPFAPPSRTNHKTWIAAAVILAGIAGSIFLSTGNPGDPTPVTDPLKPDDALAPTPALTTSAPALASAPSSASTPLPDTIEAGTDASYVAIEGGLPTVDAARGVLVMPPGADSHRVYVDGRLAGIPPPPIVVGCGRHTVKIGSQGREQSVAVPCGGSVSVDYP